MKISYPIIALYLALLSVAMMGHQFDFPAAVTALIVTVLATLPLQKSVCDYINSLCTTEAPHTDEELIRKVNELNEAISEVKGSVSNLQMASGFRQLKGKQE